MLSRVDQYERETCVRPKLGADAPVFEYSSEASSLDGVCARFCDAVF